MNEAITSVDFLKQIKSDPCGSFLFFGDEDYLKSHALRSYRDAMGIDPALAIFNFIHLDVLDYSSERLIDALTMPPMMSEKKLVAISGLDPSKLPADELEGLVGAIMHLQEFDYNNFVFIAPAGSFGDVNPKKKKVAPSLEALAEHLIPVRFDRSSDAKLISWALKHFAHYGVSAPSHVCSFLLEYCGKSMFVLANEIEKLAYYALADGRSEIKKEDVSHVCCAEIEYGAFDFTNAIIANRKSDAIYTLSAMKFKQIEPTVIMGEMTSVLSNFIKVKAELLSGASAREVAKNLKMHEFLVNRYVQAVQYTDIARLKALLAMCCEADAEIKQSYKSYIPLEKLICAM